MAAAADPPAPAAALGHPRAGEQLRKVAERKEAERPPSGRAQRRGWVGRGVPGEPGSPSPGASCGAASAPGGELTLWKQKSNCSLPKDAKLHRAASSRRASASVPGASRRALPDRRAGSRAPSERQRPLGTGSDPE